MGVRIEMSIPRVRHLHGVIFGLGTESTRTRKALRIWVSLIPHQAPGVLWITVVEIVIRVRNWERIGQSTRDRPAVRTWLSGVRNESAVRIISCRRDGSIVRIGRIIWIVIILKSVLHGIWAVEGGRCLPHNPTVPRDRRSMGVGFFGYTAGVPDDCNYDDQDENAEDRSTDSHSYHPRLRARGAGLVGETPPQPVLESKLELKRENKKYIFYTNGEKLSIYLNIFRNCILQITITMFIVI